MLLLYQIIRSALTAISLALGSAGIFALYVSFYDPPAAVIAIVMFVAAIVIVRLTNRHQY